MRTEKVKIIYYSERKSTAKQFELSWGKFISSLFGLFGITLILVSVTLAFFTRFYQNLENASISKSNTQLNADLIDLEYKFQSLVSEIGQLERKDDELRIVANLPKLGEDERNVGVGGMMNVSYDLPLYSTEDAEQVSELQGLISKLERRIILTQNSHVEITNNLEKKSHDLKHTPSIRPLIDGRITDKFGMRIDPFIEKLKNHPGIDIGAEEGTEVFATAAGTVIKVVTKYVVNKSYGKYVLIDHGTGIKTLYGHLSKILVKKGQKVDRRNPIGLVGQTGRATGPHLHYEVRKNGKVENPLTYILDYYQI